MKLSKRLSAVAKMVPVNTTLVDVGTDHAYLPVYLCEQGICPQVVASDVAPGPLSSASAHTAQAGLVDRIDCRLADGLSAVSIGEMDGAVLCGMGGKLMMRILEARFDLVRQLKYLILQPQSDADALRRYAVEHGFRITEETLIKEDGRLYQVLRIEPGKEDDFPSWQYETGPLNWNNKNPLLGELIDEIIRKKDRFLKGMEAAGRFEDAERTKKEIAEWEERKCLCHLKRSLM